MSTIGRRTGRNILSGKTVRQREDGTHVFDDYWTDTEKSNASSKYFSHASMEESSGIGTNESLDQIPPVNIGRRTGKNVVSGKIIRVKEDGTDKYEDYWTDYSDISHSTVQINTSHKSVVSHSPVAESSNQSESENDCAQSEELEDESISESPRPQPCTTVVLDKSCNTSFRSVAEDAGMSLRGRKSCRHSDWQFEDSKANSLPYHRTYNDADSSSCKDTDLISNKLRKKRQKLRKTEVRSRVRRRQTLKPILVEDTPYRPKKTADVNIGNTPSRRTSARPIPPLDISKKLDSSQEKENSSNKEPNKTRSLINLSSLGAVETVLPKKAADINIGNTANLSSRREPNVKCSQINLSSVGAVETVCAEAAKSPPKKRGRKRRSNSEASDDTGVRRSSRTRYPPLESWRNQRLVTKYIDSQNVVVELDSGLESTPIKVRKTKKITKKVLKKSKGVAQKDLEKFPVVNPVTGKEHLEIINREFNTLEWLIPNSNDGQKASYAISRSFASDQIKFGLLEIAGLGNKREQVSIGDNIHFFVSKGHIQVKIGAVVMSVDEHGSFIVPAGNAYSIKNIKGSVALLHFTAYRVPFFDFQYEEEDESS